MAIARRQRRPQLLAGKHAARAAVHPVEVNTMMNRTILVKARGRMSKVVRDRSGLPHSGWLRFLRESLRLSARGKAPLFTHSRTSSRVFVGAEAAARDGAASTAARDMAGSPRRRAEKLQSSWSLCRGAMRLASTFVAQQGCPRVWTVGSPNPSVRGFGAFPPVGMRCNQASE